MRRPSKPLVLFLAVIQAGSIVGVEAQTPINIGGVCSLRDRLNGASCGGSPSKREIRLSSNGGLQRREDFAGNPSDCTCNTPFFNIWSACELFEHRSNTLPILKDWKANCTTADITFRDNVGGDLLGDIQVPKWSQIKPTGDDTVFDVAGIVIATAARPWSRLQIVAPLASAFATLLFLAIVYATCARPESKFPLLQRPRLHLPGTASRVRSEEPKNDWVIDKDRTDEITPFSASIQRNRSDSFDSDLQIKPQAITFHPNRHAPHQVHHVPLTLASAPVRAEEPQEEPPLTSRWSDSEHQPEPTTSNLNKMKKGGKAMVPSVPNVFMGIPNPFKAKPVRVKPVAPRAGFRLDDYDASTDSMISTPKRVMQDEESDRRSVGSSLMRDVDEEQQERVTLISTEERMQNQVFLISKDGKDFSISSKSVASRSVVGSEVNTSIGVVSPTASTLSQSWRASGNTQIPPVPQLPPPRQLPPPPRVPPPRVNPIVSYDHFPLANLPEAPFHSRDRSGSESTSSSTRTLPVTVNQTTGQPARSNLLHTPLRSVYESERYPSTDSLHQRSLSQTQDATDVQAPQPILHRRGLSEDDSASFYLQSQESQANVPWVESTMVLRTGSKENLHLRKSDPSRLFPPSVRAAGYFGLPSNS